MNATLEQIEREALTLPVEERAQLADKLWDSVAGHQNRQVIMTPELEKLLDEGQQEPQAIKTTEELRRGA